MKYVTALATLILLIAGCTGSDEKDEKERWKTEIMETEKQFSEMAGKEGISEAFLHFASHEAVLSRNNRLVIGREAIRDRFEKLGKQDAGLSWKPDFVEVSACGDLGYTYGTYVYSATDSIGNTIRDEGIFHTIWKKQADGTWRFVWD